MIENGYIKLFRSLLKWEWYSDINTKILFIHLLLTVNYEPQTWRGIEIKRGQRVSSYEILASELNLSVKNIRTALKHLIQTGEVAHTATAKYGLFTVNNYDKFQQAADEPAVEGQTGGSQAAVKGQQRNKDNKSNKDKKININNAQAAPADAQAFFESVWKLYPEKKGKARVSDKSKRALLAHGYNTVKRCIERYVADKPDWKQYQHGGTFFTSGYVDYLDENYTQNATGKRPAEPYAGYRELGG